MLCHSGLRFCSPPDLQLTNSHTCVLVENSAKSRGYKEMWKRVVANTFTVDTWPSILELDYWICFFSACSISFSHLVRYLSFAVDLWSQLRLRHPLMLSSALSPQSPWKYLLSRERRLEQALCSSSWQVDYVLTEMHCFLATDGLNDARVLV